MIHFTFIETLVLAGILQAVILVIAFRQKMKTPSPEVYYFLLIVVSAVMLLARLLVFKVESPWVYRFGMFADISIFLFGPIAYIYLKRQFLVKSKVSMLHFLPAAAHFLFFTWTCMLSAETLAAQYQDGILPLAFFLIESLGWVSVTTYLGLSIFQFNKSEVSQKRPVATLLVVWSLGVVAWLMGYLDTYFVDISIWVLNYDLIWIVLPVWIHLVVYYKLITINEKSAYFKPKVKRVKKEKQELIVRELKKLTETSQLFLDADLKLDDLAKEVNTSPNDLSWVLNEVYNMTFYEFINKMRLNSFIDKVKQQEHQKKTLLALSFEVGFKSKSTFNNAFKAVYNQTPSQYITKYHG